MPGHPDFDALTSLTIEKIMPQAVDNIFGSKPLLFALTTFGSVVTDDGGTSIDQPLLYAETGNQGSYSGSDVFLTDDDEGFTRAVYDWRQYYATIKLNGITVAKNSGAPAILRLVNEEVTRAELSVSEALDEMFCGDGTGNGGKDWNGIKNIVADDNTLGGIDATAAGNDWWQSSVTTGVGDLSDFSDIRTKYLATSEGNDFITNIFTTEDLYAEYDSLMEQRQRFHDPTMANQGFETIMFHGAPIAFDRNIDEGYMYFLNLKYIQLHKLGDVWFKMSDWIDVPNQDVMLKKMLLYGNLTCSNRKRQGLLTGLTIPS